MLTLSEVRIIIDGRLGVVTLGPHLEEISYLFDRLDLVVNCKEIHVLVGAINEFRQLLLTLIQVLYRKLLYLDINVPRIDTLLEFLRAFPLIINDILLLLKLLLPGLDIGLCFLPRGIEELPLLLLTQLKLPQILRILTEFWQAYKI